MTGDIDSSSNPMICLRERQREKELVKQLEGTLEPSVKI
jgi:hypothetical protein